MANDADEQVAAERAVFAYKAAQAATIPRHEQDDLTVITIEAAEAARLKVAARQAAQLGESRSLE